MTTDPVRLLSQEDDTFAASLLKSARDGDAREARQRKIAVLGAAGGAAAVGGAAVAAAKMSSKGAFAALWGKWTAIGLAVAGGIGITTAVLLSQGGAPESTGSGAPAIVAPAMTSDGLAEPARDDAKGVSEPARDDAKGAAEPARDDAKGAAEVASAEEPARDDAKEPSAGSKGDARSKGGAIAGSGAATAPAAAGDGAKEASGGAALTPSAPASSASPAATPDVASALAEEVAAIRAAREALGRGQAQRCLELVSSYFARFPAGRMGAEARLLRVEAMFAAGQKAQAASLASSMLAQNPRSPYAARLRVIAGEDGGAKRE